jgi:ribosomal protein S18 acetylase RimI-like enzyme
MITKAKTEDISDLNTLINAAYRGESSKKGWTTEAEILTGIRMDEAELVSIMNTPNATIFKYQIENEILGCVLLEDKVDKLYLGMFCVNPELQNSGIGKKILQFANDYALEKGFKRIVMTVISTRLELISWYNRHGYLDTGKREPFPDGYEDDIILGDKLEFVVLEKTI